MVSTRRTGALLAALAVTGAAVLGTAPPASASSHREAPTITGDPVADNTDVYAFVSPDNPDTVTLIANYIPLEEPAGGPNFHKFGDDVSYQINVDNNGDAKPDITYDFRFKTTNKAKDTSFLYNKGPVTSLDDADLNVRQKYNVYEVRNGKGYDKPFIADVPVPPVNIGPRSTPDYANLARQAVKPLPGGGSVFAGQRDEGFYVDLGSIFDLGGLRPLNQAHAIKLATAKGEDGTSGYNVHTIALQVPKSRLVRADEPVIGVWATANRQKPKRSNPSDSTWVQVSRLGNPLVNEVNNPSGKKDRFNATRPVDDRRSLDEKGTTFESFTLDPELGRLIPGLYPGVTVPPAPRADLKSVFFTGVPGLNQPKNVVSAEMLRLNTSIMPSDKPSRLGVLDGDKAGFPNGRRVGDDVVDIELRAIAGVLVDGFNVSPNNILGDGVDGNDLPYLKEFPYLGTPHQGYDHLHDHGTGGS
jgi:hypothetical protein